MIQPVQQTFEGLLNSDDSPEYIAANQYVNALNFRFGKSRAGKFNRFELIESNREVVNVDLFAGTNKLVGKLEDSAKDRIVYLVWNSAGHSGIWVVDASETIYLAIEDADTEVGLGFTKDNYIHSVALVGDLLYWVNGGEPSRLNLEAALKAKNPSYSTTVTAYTFPIKETTYRLIRKPPINIPTAVKVIDATINVNQTKDTGFKFCWRYNYRDGETSTLSALSRYTPPNTPAETTAGYNAIDVTLPTAEIIEQDVMIVELVAVYPIDQTYFVIKAWDRQNTADATAITNHNAGTALTFRFSNNTVGYALDNATKVKPFDSVPHEAWAMTIAKNRLILGRTKLGRNTPKTSSLAFTVQSASSLTNPIGEWVKIDSTYYQTFPSLISGLSSNFYCFHLRQTYGSYEEGYYYTPAETSNSTGPASVDLTTWVFMTEKLATFINPICVPQVIWAYRVLVFPYNAATSSVTLINASVPATNITITAGGSTASILKSDAGYVGGVVFYDKWMRQCEVVDDGGAKATTPARLYADAGSYNYGLAWALSNAAATTEIPTWASYYAIVCSKCLRTNFFLQSRASHIIYATLNSATDEYDVITAGNNVYARTNAGIAVKADLLIGYGLGYSFNEGDILTIFISTSRYQVPVKAVQGDWVIGELIDVGNTTSLAALFEIFSPAINSSDRFYYEVSDLLPIQLPGTASRTYSTLSGTIPGDVFLITRNDGTNNYFVEAMSPNDKVWKVWTTNHGRPQVRGGIGEVYSPTGMSHSNVYIPGTRTNGLSSFDALDFTLLPLEMTSLQYLQLTTKVQQEGSVLLAIGEDDTASIYLGESQVFDASGNSFLATSDRFIGQINPLRGGYGTRHPESVAMLDGVVLWLNVVQGKVVQYSNAGLEPVSRFKMEQFWALWCTEYLSKPAAWWTDTDQRNLIIGGIDVFHREYLVALPQILETFRDENNGWDIYSGQAATAVYKVGENRWQGLYGYLAEGFCINRNVLHTFSDGKVYVHDVESSALMFYGQQQDAVVVISVSGPQFLLTKAYKNISIAASEGPDYVKARTTLPYDQETQLDGADFDATEGKYYSPWMRNLNTPGMEPAVAIVRGEVMRGQTILVQITYEGKNNSAYRSKRIFVNAVNLGIVLSKGHTF